MENYYSHYSKPTSKSIFTSLIFVLSLLIFSNVAFAENQLSDIKVSSLPDDQVEITLEFSSAPAEPLAFTTDNPARIALDFADTDLSIKDRFQDINIGQTKSISSVQSKGRTRVVVNLNSLQEYQTKRVGNSFVLRIGDNAQNFMADASETNASQVMQPTAAASRGTDSIDLIDFRRGDNNAGRVLISLSDPDTPISLVESGGRIIVNFQNATLPSSLQKRYDVSDFATPVKILEASQTNSGAQVIVRPDSNLDFEHLAYQSDNLYVLEVREIPDEIIETRRKETYEGERLSLNFQNIEVRSVLQLIADFTGLNLVVSDSVAGSLTLRLKNVPWDQALDIILKTKGLGMRENGNVLYIAPNEEIAAREKLELESQQQVEELAPLRSEFLEINYAKASDLAELLKDTNNTSIV